SVDVQVLSPNPSRKILSIRSLDWRRTLRARLMLVLFAVGVLPIGVVGSISLYKQQGIYAGLTERSLSDTARHVGQSIDRYLFERYGDVQVQARALAGVTDSAAQTRHLAQIVELYRPAYTLAILTDASGNIVATNDAVATERLRHLDLSRNDWFRTAVSGGAKKPHVEDIHDDAVLRTLHGDGAQSRALTFTMPVERNGQAIGVLRMFAGWGAVEDIIRTSGTSGHGEMKIQIRNRDGKEVSTGAAAGDAEDSVSGKYQTAGYSDFPGMGWTVEASESRRAARADFIALLKSTMMVAAIAALLIVFVAIWQANHLTRPLDLMAGTLQNLASLEADLSRRLPSERTDELGIVSRSFNTFVSNMERIIEQVIRAGMQVTMSSTQIAAGSHQLEATMSEQVAATNEVVATTNEIAATANDLASTMSAVAQMSEETAGAASRGQRDLHQMSDAVARMEEATQAVSARLAVINEKAGNIASVVTTITKVADQTNLLSLNAAIEAEKAGQFGQGFAVVAREIRRLADQTAVATLDIEKMVREMKSAVSSGVMSMEKLNEQVHHSVDSVRQVGAQLETIMEKVQEVTPRFESAHVGMQAQLQGAQQISIAMGQLSESTQQTASALRDSNRAIGELNHAASSLQTLFARFKLTAA
ncbi:MAG TPA: methyl-accepting chemotaxis protein, partial [Thermoanaerobaculia bacterium]|nr:methyl-accepting chemotaxis protein [Thermoanaerobaculia bacterium]